MSASPASPAVAEIRVFLCDDTPELRRRVRSSLVTAGGLRVVGEADDPVDGLPLIGDLQPDVVVLDLSMPRMDGLEAIAHIHERAPDAGIIVYSGFLGATMARQALALGADCYLEKSEPLPVLGAAVREVAAARRAGRRPTVAPSAPTDAAGAAPVMPPVAAAALPGAEPPADVRSLPGQAGSRGAAVAVALGLAVLIEVLIVVVHDPGIGVAQLFAVPVALLAALFGLRTGIAAAVLASVLTVAADVLGSADPGPAGYLSRIVVFTFVGVIVGWFSDRARDDVRRSNAVNAELARSNAELEQFAYIASHDLAEPLRTITGFTELLGRRYAGQLDEKADRYIEHIVNGTARMQRLIDDLLAYSRVGRMEIAPEAFPLGDAVDQVCAALSGAIAERGAVVTRDELPVVFADPPQVAQVLQNLVGNAIKFQEADATPLVHIGAERDGSLWRISVADNGIGIDPRFAHRIFRMFQRLHAQHEYTGTGIGLAICQRIVERNGGRIWVEPGPSGGSIFSFTLPGAP